jgi:apolipoprotein N-acyltransferase
MGFSFSFLPLVARTASVWGVHGLTFIWIFLIGLILHIKGFWDRSLNPRQVSLTIGALLMIGVLSLWLYPKDESETIKVGLVQPNVSQEIKWDPTRAEEHFKILLDLTDTGVRHGAELLVWPETALPYSLSGTQRELPFLSSVPLLFGAVVREGAINRNAAVLTQGGQILQKFDKIHLVPFGEYVPFKEWLSFGKLVQNAGDFLPGREEQNLIDIPGTQALIGPLICYEDIFSRSSVAHAKKGAQLLVNLTNDAWYGPTSAQSQHASHAAMQVYQTGLPMIRSTNNGVSSFITPFSRTDLKTFSRGVDVQTLPFSKTPRQTFFVWTYPLMEWLFFAIFLTALLWKNRSRTKRIFFRKSKIY